MNLKKDFCLRKEREKRKREIEKANSNISFLPFFVLFVSFAGKYLSFTL